MAKQIKPKVKSIISLGEKINEKVKDVRAKSGPTEKDRYEDSANFIRKSIGFNVDSLNNIKGITEKERTELKNNSYDNRMNVTKKLSPIEQDEKLTGAESEINMKYIKEPPKPKSDIIKKQESYNDIQNKKASIKSKS